MSGHGTVETAVEATRLGAFDFVEKPLSLTKLLRTVERALDAGRRKRLSERTHGSSLAVPDRQEQDHQGPARAGSAGRLERLAGAAGRRAGLRPRGVCALPALAVGARSAKPFFMVVGGELGRGSGGGAVRQRARRQGGAGRIRPGGGRLAVLERTRGFDQRGAACAARRDRAERLHAGRRPRAAAAQRALDQLGAGRLRVAQRPPSRFAATSSRI